MARTALASICALLLLHGAARKMDFDTAKPFGKVLELLAGMKTELAKEADADKDTHAKMTSWCQDTKDEKNRIISESDTTIQLQTTAVKENTALGQRLDFDIRTLTKEIAANKATLATAEALRKDQHDSFTKDETSLKENIEAVSAAVAAFSVSGSSLLQSESAMARLRLVVHSNYDKIRAKTSRAERMLLDDFLKDPSQFTKGSNFLQKKEGAEAEGPVDTVVGLLQAMVGDFQRDLQEEQEEDAKLEKSYQALVAAKTGEVTAAEDQVSTKEEEKATAAEKVTTGKADVAGASKAKAEAEKLLATVTEKCASSKAEFEQRSATRTEELSAVTTAVKALQGDEAKSLLSTAAFFLQLKAVDQRQARAAEVLSAAGKRLGNQAMITLGLQAKGDGILKVQEAIDGMVRSLTQQQKDEVKEHEGCQKDFSDNKASTDKKTELKGSTKGKISQLQSDITTTEEAITKLKEDSEEMAKQLQAAKENREKEMGEFADTVAEQQHTQKLLGEALEALQAFYAKPALVQVRRHEADPKPEDFQQYKTNAGGEKVMALIREVSDSSATLEKEAKQADEDSRIAFEKLSDETKAEMRSATEETNNKAIHKADLEADLAEAKQTLRLTKDELESLSDSKDAIHKSCDFVVENFAVRQEAHGQEIKALEEAKAILG